MTESVTVTGGAPLVSTQNTELGVVIGEQQVRNLPLNGRNFAQLIALEPGAVVSAAEQCTSTALTRDGVNITVDGTDASNPDRPATSNFGGQTQQNVLSVEFIQEFKTTKGVFSAELGRAASGGVNVITKSGTNEFHGSVYEFLRNDRHGCAEFLRCDKRQTEAEPVRRHRRRSDPAQPHVLLRWMGRCTGAARKADLRAKCRPSRCASACSRQIRCTDRCWPCCRPPRKTGATRTGASTAAAMSERNTENSVIGRLDFNPTSKDNLFVRYSILDSFTLVPSLSPVNGTEYPAQDQTATLSWNRILTPRIDRMSCALGVNKQDIPRATQAFVPQQIGNLNGFSHSQSGTAPRQWRQLDLDRQLRLQRGPAFAQIGLRIAQLPLWPR